MIALFDHVDGDLHGRRGGALRDPRLEHVQLAALDRELEVLDVAVVALQPLADAHELVVRLGHLVLELADLLRACGCPPRRPRPGRWSGTRRRAPCSPSIGVAGERDAGAGVVAHVAEHHRHDVHGRAQVVGDLLVVAVDVGPLAEPRGEHGLDRQVQLLVRVAREVAAGVVRGRSPGTRSRGP